MSALTDFREKFRIPELTVQENQDWVWSMRPTQPTLGASVISFKREASSLSDVGASEAASMVELIFKAEQALKDNFGTDRVNIMLLMHFDTHLHFHLIPRYKSPVNHFDTEWVDTGWPGFPANMTPGEGAVPDSVLNRIRDALARRS